MAYLLVEIMLNIYGDWAVQFTLPLAVPELSVNFADTDDWHSQRIAFWSVTSGAGNNKFDPNGIVTREQMATFLVNLMNYDKKYNREGGGEELTNGDLSKFSDANQVSSWAKDSMARMVGEGLMQGSGGKLDPKGQCTIEHSSSEDYQWTTVMLDPDNPNQVLNASGWKTADETPIITCYWNQGTGSDNNNCGLIFEEVK